VSVLRFACATFIACALTGVFGPVAPAATSGADPTGTRLSGLRLGPHAVGFKVESAIDPTRGINLRDGGTRIGLALWYPALSARERAEAVSALDYRLLEFFHPLPPAARDAYEQEEAAALLAWRHVGIVDMTTAQARASLRTAGIAVRGARRAHGRFPVVMILGGRYYMSSTAEFLASHGYLVAAPFRYADQSNEVGTEQFTWYVENSVRDAEWALDRLRSDGGADVTAVSAVGHGGGGMLAMLFAMRNRGVGGLVNIDAANFSQRSRPRDIPYYSPRLVRAPFLYIATAETKKGLDLFEDFAAMTFSERYDVTLQNPELRHHDLSDLGRAVTAPLAIRGAAGSAVQRDYALVHDITLRFLQRRTERPADQASFGEWLESAAGAAGHTVAVHGRVEPAPTTVRVLETLGRGTVEQLRGMRAADPSAAVYQAENLARIVTRAITNADFPVADAVVQFALELHPDAPLLLELHSRVLEVRGDAVGALAAARRCGAIAPGSSWRAVVAINACRERVERLAPATKD
jgi:hypothetical protein